MQALRAFLHGHRRLAMLLVAFALVFKAGVPAGYMLGQHGKVLTVEVCADASAGKVIQRIVVPHSDTPPDSAVAHEKETATCAFAALGFAALDGADAVLLALALAFILTLGFAPAPIAGLQRIPFLRPPLRGPPALT